MIRNSTHIVALAVVSAMALVGCSSSATDPEASPSDALSDECAEYMTLPADKADGLLAVVVDGTASGRRFEDLPALREAIAHGQSQNWATVMVPVDGPGVAPTTVGPLPLDPSFGANTAVGDRAREMALTCASGLAASDLSTPQAAGSDQLAAIAAALRMNPDAIIVASDGVPVGGLLDVEAMGFDADAEWVADQIDEAMVPTVPASVPVTWIGMGETQVPLPESARANLQHTWGEILSAGGAKVQFDSRTGAPVGDATKELPADSFTVPEVASIESANGSVCAVVPSALLFAANSTEITNTEGLNDIVAALKHDPEWEAHVEGHTADFGTPDGRARTSLGRADNVKAYLQSQGLSNTITTEGVGATKPRANEWPDGPTGPRDLAASALNRVTVITYGPSGSLSESDC